MREVNVTDSTQMWYKAVNRNQVCQLKMELGMHKEEACIKIEMLILDTQTTKNKGYEVREGGQHAPSNGF